jgi:hypothetical protein
MKLDRSDIEKLCSDIPNHFQSNYGSHFAKAIANLIAHDPDTGQREQLLFVIEQLSTMLIERRCCSGE